MKRTQEELMLSLKVLGLININNIPVPFTVFKNRATIMRYGPNKVVYIGQPNKSLFGFYPFGDNDIFVMKEAYRMFLKLSKGNMEAYDRDEIQWGNCEVPRGYRKLTID